MYYSTTFVIATVVMTVITNVVKNLLAAAFAFRNTIEEQQIMLQLSPQCCLVCQLLPQLLVLSLHALDAHALLCQAPRQQLYTSNSQVVRRLICKVHRSEQHRSFNV